MNNQPESVVGTYRPLLCRLVEALRRGTMHAQAYAEQHDEEIDRALAPPLVRKEAKRRLLKLNEDVQDEEEEDQIDYETQSVPNLGLSVRAGAVQIRILRSAAGSMLPLAGDSMARQEYYTQPLFPELAEGSPETGGLLRLVLHWDTDAEYNLTRVYLACPKSGGKTRETVMTHWDEPIWRRHQPEVDGQVQAEVKDVDIYLDDKADTA